MSSTKKPKNESNNESNNESHQQRVQLRNRKMSPSKNPTKILIKKSTKSRYGTDNESNKGTH